ncbi:AraC family transcriptional regulator [Bordetella genomosp. 7]|uniref:AraC family transcriptional regulator n=1 Tax=Bordetella TaxID=517 RepID=UPI0004787186|nr:MULTISPECIES: AraC family transcriptional regulator [Bordetella]OZI16953.1 AraC family transcriptional regulator [Bordetella genomosp. 7]
MADRLAALMAHFPVSAKVYGAGAAPGFIAARSNDLHGQLHLVRSGRVDFRYGQQALCVERPSLLLISRLPNPSFVVAPEPGADMVGATLSFEGGAYNPIAAALPDLVCLPLEEIDGAAPVLAVLFDEAQEQRCGRVALVERLFEVVMIQVLRQLMETGKVRGGLLSGLAHARLRNALVAMHEAPAKEWTLDSLAEAAGMSRSVFATTFRDTVGITPGQYLQSWRVRLAQKALQRGRPLKIIAAEVGYGSEAALSRAFKAHSGRSPREWKAEARAN